MRESKSLLERPQRTLPTALPAIADIVAGLTLWAMLVPQSLGFSVLAGLPPVIGLYAALGATSWTGRG